jgi:hypothetical protein
MSSLTRIKNGLRRRVRRVSKHVYQSIRWRALDRPKVLMIVGCQRSGTALVSQLFDADRDCRVFGEFSSLSSVGKDGIRLNPLPDVAAVLSRVPAPLVVMKPLVETQRLRTLLKYFPDAKALFMYRRYADVAASDLGKFGPRNAIDNIRPIAAGDTHNWRSAGATPAVRAHIARFFSESMNPNDAAALFWFARNQLYYDLELAAQADVMLCRYEHLATEPSLVFPTQASALQPFATQVLSLVNLTNLAALGSPGAAHAMGTGTIMTGSTIPDVAGGVLYNDVSLDQLVVRETAPDTRFSSLQWSAGEPGPCDVGGSSCAYTQSISWTGPASPLVATIDPKVAFDRLFGRGLDGLEGPAAELRRQSLGSTVDFVREDALALQARLGHEDSMRLDEYFTALTELEKSLLPATECAAMPEPPIPGLPYP